MHRDIALLQGFEAGVLYIGCGPFPAEVLAGDAIAKFNNHFPKLSVKITVDLSPRLITLLRERSVDFLVAEIDHLADLEGIDIIPMPQQQVYFCCRKQHPLTNKQHFSFNDLC